MTESSLLDRLIGQAPNRIYCSDTGSVVRVLFFSETEHPYQALVEQIEFSNSEWKRVKSEKLIGSTEWLDHHINFLRKTWGMSGDLLEEPDLIIKTTSFLGEQFVNICHQPSLSYVYMIKPLRVRALSLDPGIALENGEILDHIPQSVSWYAHPFKH